jgi:cytochrome b subunit of formate dehydrogenase
MAPRWQVWLITIAAAAICAAQDTQQAACSSCHDLKVEGVHAAVSCQTCHTGHSEYPHPTGAKKPACATCHDKIAKLDAEGVHGRAVRSGNPAAPDCGVCHGSAHQVLQPKGTAFRTAMPDTCGMCHDKIASDFKVSVHGKAVAMGLPEAPVCTDCHGAHSIQSHLSAASPVSPGRIRETCGTCHGDVRLSRRFGLPADRLLSFDASFHGLAAKSGSQTVANCASCHGVHNILPSSDPKSTIYPANVSNTCGQCHAGAGKRFAIGQIHVIEGRTDPEPVRWARLFYLLVIPLTIGFMLLHNFGDWFRKVRRLRFGMPAVDVVEPATEIRMMPLERVQHALLVASFFVLVWTGFALKYPDHWWARPLLIWESSWPVRSWVHRAAGVLFIAVTVAHAVLLIVNRSLREHWMSMIPRRRDVVEAFEWFVYNIGLRGRPAPRSHHSYIEKAEYWAVVWGAAIMILSGVMLWGHNIALRMLPKWALDLATAVHFYEAVLATLAIVVWHFYTVIFDPEVYPLDTAWLNGRTVRRREGQA